MLPSQNISKYAGVCIKLKRQTQSITSMHMSHDEVQAAPTFVMDNALMSISGLLMGSVSGGYCAAVWPGTSLASPRRTSKTAQHSPSAKTHFYDRGGALQLTPKLCHDYELSSLLPYLHFSSWSSILPRSPVCVRTSLRFLSTISTYSLPRTHRSRTYFLDLICQVSR